DSAKRDDARADGGQQVGRSPTHLRRIRIDPPRHALEAQDVHREKSQIETNEQDPEVQLPDGLVHQTPSHFRIPVIKATEQREERAPNQHVMEMRDNEKRVVDLQIEGHGTQQHAGESAQYEDGDEAEDKMQGSVQSQTAAPERGDPAEDL